MTRMTETERETRRENVLRGILSMALNGIRDADQVLSVLDVSRERRVQFMTLIRDHADEIIRRLER